jgi:hypothetical protein
VEVVTEQVSFIVGFVAAGVFIKMDRRFDVEPGRARAGSSAPLLPGDTEKNSSAVDSEGALPLFQGDEARSSYTKLRLLAIQYAVPLALPPLFAFSISALV